MKPEVREDTETGHVGSEALEPVEVEQELQMHLTIGRKKMQFGDRQTTKGNHDYRGK